MSKMSLFECEIVGALQTLSYAIGLPPVTTVISPTGKLDDAAQAKILHLWEVWKENAAAVVAAQEPGVPGVREPGLFFNKDTAPSASSVLGGFKPILDKLVPLLPGSAGTIAQGVLSVLTGLGSGGTATPPATTTSVPVQQGNP